jgi:hypothetical protein
MRATAGAGQAHDGGIHDILSRLDEKDGLERKVQEASN